LRRSVVSSLPSSAQIAAERERRAARRLADSYAELGDAQRPPWPPEADSDPEAWMRAHWSGTAYDAYEIEERALCFEVIDSAMGALALAVCEAGHDQAALAALLGRLGLPCWPAGSSEEARTFRRDRWGAWEAIYFERWLRWAPLDVQGRRAAHAREWRRHLEGEAMEVRAHGSCWWRSMTMPNSTHKVACVDLVAGLRLAVARGHDETYPRPLPAEAESEESS
jgi:hypothetical protein